MKLNNSRICIDDATRNLVCGLSGELYEESIHGSQLSKEGATSAKVFGALLGLLRGPDRPFPEHSLALSVQHSHTHKGEEGLRISLEFNDLPF